MSSDGHLLRSAGPIADAIRGVDVVSRVPPVWFLICLESMLVLDFVRCSPYTIDAMSSSFAPRDLMTLTSYVLLWQDSRCMRGQTAASGSGVECCLFRRDDRDAAPELVLQKLFRLRSSLLPTVTASPSCQTSSRRRRVACTSLDACAIDDCGQRIF